MMESHYPVNHTRQSSNRQTLGLLKISRGLLTEALIEPVLPIQYFLTDAREILTVYEKLDMRSGIIYD